MGRYTKIERRIWSDEKFRELPDDAKLVFFLVLTHPHMTAFGAMRCSIPSLSADLGWSLKRLREPFGELLRLRLIAHDENASFLMLPNWFKYNGPQNPNQIKGWANQWEDIPECKLKVVLYQDFRKVAERFGKPLPKQFRLCSGHEPLNPEPEPEPEETPIVPRGDDDENGELQQKQPPPDERAFQAFWDAVPRKVGKQVAWRAFVKARRRVGKDREIDESKSRHVLVDAMKEFAESPKARGDYCPNPATWLTQGRYDDDRKMWEERSPGISVEDDLGGEGVFNAETGQIVRPLK